MTKRANFPHRRRQRREEAEERAASKANRTPGEHLALLEDRGHRNCSEATALREAIRDGQVKAD